ncbi:MAG: class I SAM-dependent methyltransferase [Gemmatimonadota bacterium]
MSADPLSSEALRWLAGAEGGDCLRQATAFTADQALRAQDVLRAQYPADRVRAALALVAARRAAVDKFGPVADGLYGDRDGVEMASRPEIAAYRAGRFAGRGRIADLGCGIGGDLVALAAGHLVCGVDLDPARLTAARLNAAAAGVDERAVLVRADAASYRPRVDAVFADPARRREGRRIRAAAAYGPPLTALLAWRERVPALAVKVAPGIDEAELPADGEVEFISAAGQCREGVLWQGELARCRRRATVLPGPHALIDASGPPVPVGPPGTALYDPDPAVVRAHLVQELARHLDAWLLDPQVAYLSGSGPPRPTPFARAYRLLDRQPFHLKRLRDYLRAADLAAAEIKKRRFPIPADQLRQLLGAAARGACPVTLVFTRIAARPEVLVCQPVP